MSESVYESVNVSESESASECVILPVFYDVKFAIRGKKVKKKIDGQSLIVYFVFLECRYRSSPNS